MNKAILTQIFLIGIPFIKNFYVTDVICKDGFVFNKSIFFLLVCPEYSIKLFIENQSIKKD